MKEKQKFKPHLITGIMPDSIAEALELEIGDQLLSINNERIQDVFDYRYLMCDEERYLTIQKKEGERWELGMEKA